MCWVGAAVVWEPMIGQRLSHACTACAFVSDEARCACAKAQSAPAHSTQLCHYISPNTHASRLLHHAHDHHSTYKVAADRHRPARAKLTKRTPMQQMDTEAAAAAGTAGASSLVQRPTSVPRPRPFPILENAPGPRCGHTLTTISGPEGDVNRAKLVLFGARLLFA